MKAQLWTTLAVSFFGTLGNGQDGAVAPTIVQGASGPGIQGNVGWTQAQQDAELERAALAARQKKALMESMASYSQKPPVITSAEQYLQVHRSTVPRSPEGSGLTPQAVRSNNYVPAFETGATGRGIANPSPAPSNLPEKKTGLFSLFKSKEKEEISGDLVPNPYSGEAAPPAASYPETPAMSPDPASVPPAPAPIPADEANDAIAAATEGAPPGEKPSLFGRLFGKSKATEPSAVPDPTLSAPTVPASPPLSPTTEAPASTDPVGIPSPPSFSGATAPTSAPSESPSRAPATEGSAAESSIFVRRAGGGTAGSGATVLTTTQATVAGVLVKLYEGSSVTVLERSGSMARIRLSDGRDGTVAASALSR